MRLGRRGTIVDLMLSPAFMLLVGLGIILIFLLGRIGAIGEDTAFQKDFLAKDFALLLDAVPAARGNLDVYFGPQKPEFGNSPSAFRYSVRGHTVRVFEEENDPDAGMASFADASTAAVTDAELAPLGPQPVLPRILKMGGTVEITQAGAKRAPKLLHLDCPVPRADLGSLVIDAAHGYSPRGGEKSDPGHTIAQVRESTFTRVIAKGIVDRASQRRNDILVTRTVSPPPSSGEQAGEEELLTPAERASRASRGDTLISIHAGNAKSGTQPAIAYVLADGARYDASYKLACEMINALAGRFALTQAAVVPLLRNQLPEASFGILSPSKAGVILEVGNIADTAVLDQAGVVSDAIWEGVNRAQS